jgi:hypothetical protein
LHPEVSILVEPDTHGVTMLLKKSDFKAPFQSGANFYLHRYTESCDECIPKVRDRLLAIRNNIIQARKWPLEEAGTD